MRSWASWAAAAWASSTGPGRSGSNRPCRPEDDPGRRPCRRRGRRPLPGRGRGRRPACSTPTSCRSTTSARPTACPSSSWSTSTAAAWTGGSTAPPGRRGEAAELIEALARGVAEAHRLGIVHRDLKPGNILLAADGTPKVTDFGLAKSLDADSGLTRTDSIMGSPSYMAPEQAEGKTKRGRARSPTSTALGAILYELLTGRPAVPGHDGPGDARAGQDRRAGAAVAAGAAACRATSRRSRLKCLQKEPAKRYDSAAALAEDLRRFLAGEPIRGAPGRPGGAGLAVVPAQPGPGGPGGGRGRAAGRRGRRRWRSWPRYWSS